MSELGRLRRFGSYFVSAVQTPNADHRRVFVRLPKGFRGRPRWPHRLKAGRTDHAQQSGNDAEAADRKGAGGALFAVAAGGVEIVECPVVYSVDGTIYCNAQFSCCIAVCDA